MTELLPLEDHSVGDAAMAGTLGVRWVELASLVNDISLLLSESVAKALLILAASTLSLPLEHLLEESIERIVLSVLDHIFFLFSWTVGTALIWWMGAFPPVDLSLCLPLIFPRILLQLNF